MNDRKHRLHLSLSAATAPLELHVRREARERYGVDRTLFGLQGNAILADIQATRRLAQAMNRERDLARHPDRVVRAGDINAMGLIDEILHHVVGLYREQHGTRVVAAALEQLDDSFGAGTVDEALSRFGHSHPPSLVFRGEMELDEYLTSEFEGRTGRELLLEEMLMLRLSNSNPAFSPFSELFSDEELARETRYHELIGALDGYFAQLPTFGPDEQHLIEMLATPSRRFPESLFNQLRYIRERWGGLLGSYLLRLLRGMDVLREEGKTGLLGPGPTEVYRFGADDPERFSPDSDWMPRVIILAKSTLVWLDQLSRSYGREVSTLDQIPDEELDLLARRGVTGLWLIGLWERSSGSRRIKNIMGNPDAEASAYSLNDYDIAAGLGGWEALVSLRTRCDIRGIRLASDMVPNHTGINGRWVIEHPDWFVQLGFPPFPSYTFSGENLSGVESVGIYLEDHYYSRSDAAVVFKRTDLGSGEERFIYHGNDGTSMPWNDTAQLDFANPGVREAVIQTILHVARNFSIIRFDAAMTLAKRHIQRLWYPEPGSGGDIPSRAEHGMTAEAFDQAIPQEFWREVVDRVAAEAPDTLLLAEAFWMMEGYFVRTLGMHRVYNSAFMNMLKNEENAKYRQTIKNTIEFDKEILKRFVNFMNNPDEETAIAQFGSGDKYFGVCTLMVTMPGLPMIGHGQIEGFTEKYGMEYRRAYLNEEPNVEIVARHERDIFPLMRRRYLFSGVDEFLLYDLYQEDGTVNENVFAYSNAADHQRVLVLYNNAYERAYGWIRESAGYIEKAPDGSEHRRSHLAAGLSLSGEAGRYTLFQNQRNCLWFIRSSAEIHEKGLFVELSGYESQVYLDVHEVVDNEFGHYAQLYDSLNGAGVTDMGQALREIAHGPLLDLFGRVANSSVLHAIRLAIGGEQRIGEALLAQIESNYATFLELGARYVNPLNEETEPALAVLREGLTGIERLPFSNLTTHRKGETFRGYQEGLQQHPERVELLGLHLLLAPLRARYESAAGICEEWGLAARAAKAFASEPSDLAWITRVNGLLTLSDWWCELRDLAEEPGEQEIARQLVDAVLTDGDLTVYLELNEYDGVIWYNGERFRELRWWLGAIALLSTPVADTESVALLDRTLGLVDAAAAAADYRVDRLIQSLAPQSERDERSPEDPA